MSDVKEASSRTKCNELRRAGYLLGESAGGTCADCDKNCGRGWWKRVSYEYNEWECWCRDCAYKQLHMYDDCDFDEMMRCFDGINPQPAIDNPRF